MTPVSLIALFSIAYRVLCSLLQHGTRKAAAGAPPASLHPGGLRDFLGCFGTPGNSGGKKKPGGVKSGEYAGHGCVSTWSRLGRIGRSSQHCRGLCRFWLGTHAKSFVPGVPKQPKKSRRRQGCSEAGGAPPVAFRVTCCNRGHHTPG